MYQQNALIELVRNFRYLHALVVGDSMLDTYLEGTATRLCSEGPIPVVAKTAEYRLPGGAANTAANLHALGAQVSLLSVHGKDLSGSQLRSVIQNASVSPQWLIEDDATATQHKLRILADGQYVVRFDEGGTREDHPTLSRASQQRLLDAFATLYQQCDLLIVSDYGYGVASDTFIEQLRILQSNQRKLLLIDSKALHRFCTVHATIVTPNYQEAQVLIERLRATVGTSSDRSVEQMGQQILTFLQSDYVAITLGKQGVCLFARGRPMRRIPAYPVAHANDVGAGDSFIAALALALASGGDIEEAATIGVNAASLVVSQQRTAVARHQELLQRVSVRAYANDRQTLIALPGKEQGALRRLSAALQERKRSGKKLVLTNGIFDTLHAGHVHFLRMAKALGDILVVGINSDQSVQHLKGQGRPITSAHDRLALVAALDMVDEAVIFEEETPAQLIRLLRPDIHVKGGDYAYETLPEAQAVQEVGGQVVILPLADGLFHDPAPFKIGRADIQMSGRNDSRPFVERCHTSASLEVQHD